MVIDPRSFCTQEGPFYSNLPVSGRHYFSIYPEPGVQRTVAPLPLCVYPGTYPGRLGVRQAFSTLTHRASAMLRCKRLLGGIY
jgi:hypothetical protein